VATDDRAHRPGPLILAGADTLLLQLDHPEAAECRRALTRFAQLERSPGRVDSYRLTDLGLWNAKATGLEPDDVIATIERHGPGPAPRATVNRITEAMDRFGPVTLESDGDRLLLRTAEPDLLDRLLTDREVAGVVVDRPDARSAVVQANGRGPLKLALTRLRHPADDRADLRPGRPIDLALRPGTELRPYQRDAVQAWLGSGTGVVVLPCGAGKTVTALAAAAEIGTTTLVLTTGGASMDQWERELDRFTNLATGDVGRYGGGRREVRPVTLATYQMLATRRDGRYRNLELIDDNDWGLVIYDEVHLLPAAVFGLSAGIQARRRLGLTATLVREDGREADVFTLIGPKRYDIPWSDLELQGWIAPARCTEIRVVPSDDERMAHARAGGQARARVAAGVAAKLDVVGALLDRHRGEQTLIIGTYLDGLTAVADRHRIPLVTGRTPERTRLALFDRLRRGELSSLAVSKVGNYSIDLPEVSVAIQVSGTFGSRQEEAQRLGRLLRPKASGRQASFYTLVARDTIEQEHSARRQRFLTEQGYHYEIRDGADYA
jgi:DNA excision repair protein ERCC-3